MAEIAELFRMSTEFLQKLMAQQTSMMKALVEEVQGKKGDGGGGSYPDERRFRDMESFDGKEDK